MSYVESENYGEVMMRNLRAVRAQVLEGDMSASALIGQQTLLLILREDAVFKKFANADMHTELRTLLVDVSAAIDAKIRGL